MKLLTVFTKSLREQLRDPLGLSLSLLLSPFFVFLYSLFFPSGGSTTYGVLVINQDVPALAAGGYTLSAGEDLIEAMKAVTYADGQPILNITLATDRAEAERKLKDRDAAALVIIPPDFSSAILAASQGEEPTGAAVTFIGDLTNPYYAVAAVMAGAGLEAYVTEATGQTRPIGLIEIPLGDSAARTEFEVYVPGLLVFSGVMMVFMASMMAAQEVEAGTLRRLQITRMTSFDLLGGISLSLVATGIIALLLSYLTAIALGFRSQGPLWVAVLIGVLTILTIMGTGLVVAAFSRSVNQAFLLANFPMVLYMFFSGMMFPIPQVELFEIAGQTISLYDFLPPTHAVVALNKVLSLGAGLGEVAYELTALTGLTVIYFAAGVWLFQRNHMRGG